MSGVAAVIVSYDSEEVLGPCLDALYGKVEQAVVVDNTPVERIPRRLQEAYPWAVWIDKAVNRGFAAAVNQGVAATEAQYVLLLNPDCELLTDLDGLVEACRGERVAGAGGLLLDPDGSLQTGFFARSLPTPAALVFEALGLNRVWKRNPVNRQYRLLDMDPHLECDVEQPAGAFLLLRRDALEAVGGLDETFYPAWFEDVDLCRRLYNAGYTLRFTPRAAATHLGGHAFREVSLQVRLQAWYGGLLRYAAKHYSHGTHGCVRCAVLAGLTLRKVSCCLGAGSPADAAAYGSMRRLVRSGFPARPATV